MKHLKTLLFAILLITVLSCERFDFYCWECIQTQTAEGIDFTFADKYTYPNGLTEDQIRVFEDMHTYDAYFYIYNDSILTHLVTTCRIRNN